MGDGALLRLLLERLDRSEDDRLWLLDAIQPFQLDDLLGSPATTIEHARRARARCERKPWMSRGGAHDSDVAKVEQLSPDEAMGIIVRWPGHQPAEPLLWALLGRVVHLPEPS
jgi:hypothetical protein